MAENAFISREGSEFATYGYLADGIILMGFEALHGEVMGNKG